MSGTLETITAFLHARSQEPDYLELLRRLQEHVQRELVRVYGSTRLYCGQAPDDREAKEP